MNLLLSNWFRPVSFNFFSKLLSLGHHDKGLTSVYKFHFNWLITHKMGEKSMIFLFNASSIDLLMC